MPARCSCRARTGFHRRRFIIGYTISLTAKTSHSAMSLSRGSHVGTVSHGQAYSIDGTVDAVINHRSCHGLLEYPWSIFWLIGAQHGARQCLHGTRMKHDLNILENKLDQRGYSQEVRVAIRNARICIIDDRIEDLRGVVSGLKNEGFTNIVEVEQVNSIEELLEKRYDLVVLDLRGVAVQISSADGYGVLQHLKSAQPALPVLVLTGSTTPPDKVNVIALADLIRSKPVKALELVSDVEQLLRPYKDEHWAALEILKELRRLDADLRSELALKDRLIIWWRRRQLQSRLTSQSGSTVNAIVSVGNVVATLGKVGLKVVDIAKKFQGVP